MKNRNRTSYGYLAAGLPQRRCRDRNEGSREREDWMSEVKDNIRPGLGEDWIKVDAARCEKCGLGKLVEG